MKKKIFISLFVMTIFLITSCSSMFPFAFFKNDKPVKTEVKKVELNNSRNIEKEFMDLFKKFEEAKFQCKDKDIELPNPVIKDKHILYTMSDQEKVNLKILTLKECVEKLYLIQEKYNSIIKYTNLYMEFSNIDTEFKKDILELQQQRIEFYSKQVDQYDTAIEKLEKKHFWSTFFERILSLGVIVIALVSIL